MRRILLVEDDLDLRMLVEHVLRDAGYEVDCAATMTKARALVAAQSYDLVLTDGKLTDGTGVRVADDAVSRGMKALVVTGHLLQFPKAELDRHEFLMKPVRPAELLAVVERTIGAASA